MMINKAIEDIYGPQSASDNPFTRKARLLQSYYRLNVLKEKEFGIGPNENSVNKIKGDNGDPTGETEPSYHGNMLVEGNKSGSNFLKPEIFDYVKFRLQFLKNGETINEFRIFNNMLSSQPMCFNLFFPIKSLFEQDDRAATKILSACFPSLKIRQVLAVEIEYLPYPINEYLGDRTAFDAMMIYKTESNEKNILAIETKYVEKLGENPSSDFSKQIHLVENSPLFNQLGKEEAKKGFGQLGRNFLLAEKFRQENCLDKAFAVIISPKENDSSKSEIERFYKMMNMEFHERLFYVELKDMVKEIKKTVPRSLSEWINEFDNRYLNFSLIENLLQQ